MIDRSGILVFGGTGQVGRALARLEPRARLLGRTEAPLDDPDALVRAIARAAPVSAIVNAAAWTAVDAAEDHPGAAARANADAPGVIGREAARLGLPMVHLSTDYVFDGSGSRPWRPEDAPAPLGVYGATKRAGEEAVLASGAPAVILRTSWVFSAHGTNFVRTMLRLSETRDRLRVVSDQIGGPTSAAAIADATLRILDGLAAGARPGIYHFSGAPDTNWADFARAIFRRAGRTVTVTDIAAADYPTRARRPLNSRLDCSTTRDVFGIARPDWRADLDAVLAELDRIQTAGSVTR